MPYTIFEKGKVWRNVVSNITYVKESISKITEPAIVSNYGFLCEITPNKNVLDIIQIGSRDFSNLKMQNELNIKNIDLKDIYIQSQHLNNVPEIINFNIRQYDTTMTIETIINSELAFIAIRKIANHQALQNGMKKFICDLIKPLVSFQTFMQNNTQKIKKFDEFIKYIKHNSLGSIWDSETVRYSTFSNFKTFVTNLDFDFIKNFIKTNQIKEYKEQIIQINDLLQSIDIRININLKGIKFFKYKHSSQIILGNAIFKTQHGIIDEMIIPYLISQNILNKLIMQLERLKLLSK